MTWLADMRLWTQDSSKRVLRSLIDIAHWESLSIAGGPISEVSIALAPKSGWRPQGA